MLGRSAAKVFFLSSKQLNSKRRRLGCLTAVVFTVLLLVAAVHEVRRRTALPFTTIQSFVTRIHSGQISDAQAMILARDRSKLPDSYWDRLRDTQFRPDDSFLMSYTPTTLLSGVVTFRLVLPPDEGEDQTQVDSVRYHTQGSAVAVSEVHPQDD